MLNLAPRMRRLCQVWLASLGFAIGKLLNCTPRAFASLYFVCCLDWVFWIGRCGFKCFPSAKGFNSCRSKFQGSRPNAARAASRRGTSNSLRVWGPDRPIGQGGPRCTTSSPTSVQVARYLDPFLVPSDPSTPSFELTSDDLRHDDAFHVLYGYADTHGSPYFTCNLCLSNIVAYYTHAYTYVHDRCVACVFVVYLHQQLVASANASPRLWKTPLWRPDRIWAFGFNPRFWVGFPRGSFRASFRGSQIFGPVRVVSPFFGGGISGLWLPKGSKNRLWEGPHRFLVPVMVVPKGDRLLSGPMSLGNGVGLAHLFLVALLDIHVLVNILVLTTSQNCSWRFRASMGVRWYDCWI